MSVDSAAGAVAEALPAAESGPEMVDSVRGLVSPPDVCARVLELLRSQTASANDIGEVVQCDPNLTVRLLRIVNSPLYALRSRVDTVPRAIAIVGGDVLANLVIAITAVASFKRIPIELVNMDTFWRHSLYTALIARQIARECNVLHPEQLFVAGLLHDVGSLVLYYRAPRKARRTLAAAAGDEGRLATLEQEAFGFSHADLGGLLLETWMLPEALQDAVAGHHDLERAGEARYNAAIVHIAEALANQSGIGAYSESPCADPAILDAAWETLGTTAEALDCESLIGEAGLQFADTADLLTSAR